MGRKAVPGTPIIVDFIEGMTEACNITALRALYKRELAMVELDILRKAAWTSLVPQASWDCLLNACYYPTYAGKESHHHTGEYPLQIGNEVVALALVDREDGPHRMLMVESRHKGKG